MSAPLHGSSHVPTTSTGAFRSGISSLNGGSPSSNTSSFRTLRTRESNPIPQQNTSSRFGRQSGSTTLEFSPGSLLADPNSNSRPPFAKPEDFEDMVGDLRRTFIGWLKRTETELRKERDNVYSDRKQFEEEMQKTWKNFQAEKQAEYQKMQEEKKRLEAETTATMKQIAVEREDARERLLEERNKFDREKDLWKRQSIMEREKLMQEVDAFEEEKQKIADASTAVKTMVDLNVGGNVIETSRHTLIQQRGSYLEALLSGRHHVTRDPRGRIFIDRDPELFRILMQFLRNPGTPPCPRDAAESAAICNEAAYFGLKFFPFPIVFALGGHNGIEHLNSVEFLDIEHQSWRGCASLETPRTYFGNASLTGRLYAFGGQNFDYKALCDVETYDILRDAWMPAPPLNIPRRNNCGTALGNRIYTIGGFDGANILSSVEALDPRMRNWMEIAPLSVPRSSTTCCVLGESLFVAGGSMGERTRTVERYDPRASKWENVTSMIEVRSAASSCVFLSSIFTMGGVDNANTIHNSIEALDIHSMKWIFRRHMPQPRMDAASVVASESIMVAGGQNETVLNSTIFYQPELDEWSDGKVVTSEPY